MITSTSTLMTRNARSYLEELGSHFSQRATVSQSEDKIQITLHSGRCDLTATDSGLSACLTARAAKIDQIEDVFGGWIERLAFRENATLTWHRSA